MASGIKKSIKRILKRDDSVGDDDSRHDDNNLKKLETFIGPINQKLQSPETSSIGDWNAHLFTIERMKSLLFMNNRTCYSVIMSGILKKDTKNFELLFKERLIQQLDHELELNESQEVNVRRELTDIAISKSTNDKKIIGTINHHVDNLKYNNYRDENGNWNDLQVTRILNDYPIGTRILANKKSRRGYFKPIELMEALLR